MLRDRTLRLQFGHRLEAVYLLGTRLSVDVFGAAPPEAVNFNVKHSQEVSVEVISQDQSDFAPADGAKQWPLDPGTFLQIQMTQPSLETNESKVTVGYYGENGEHPINQAGVFLTGIGISLDVDADRDGVVEKNNPQKATWTWGPDGQGAILLVNCDKENPFSSTEDCQDEKIFSKEDLEDMSRMILRTQGPDRLPAGYEMVLHIPLSDTDKVGVFYLQNPFFGQRYIHILGRRKLSHVVKYTGGSAKLEFFVEGLRFPDESFDGLVSIHVSLLEPMAENRINWDPWMEADFTLRQSPSRIAGPLEMPPGGSSGNQMVPLPKNADFISLDLVKDNYLFLKEINNLVSKSGCKINVCSRYMNRSDRWMQDEIEFGYIQAPHKQFPVVLDSPRDGGLKYFAVKEILGPDFGYVTQEPLFEAVTSLDSFGNLEVSPPVSVHGKEYPLGRILIGSSFPTGPTSGKQGGSHSTRATCPLPQSDQPPPPSFPQQFRMLMASPSACYKFFREKQKEGHGEAIMFKGYSGTDTKRVTINKVLSNEIMVQENHYVQRCIDWNRDILKKELGLKERDIIDLPALFKMDREGKAMAYFPNMVNMIVLSRDLGVPKPFGPIIEGECCLEQHVTSLLEPLGLTCTFIDDISSYHKLLGEVHCGTNVQRKPFAFSWWKVVP
ncbi:hypothetical protein Chor_008233 [Crotalus horridus]